MGTKQACETLKTGWRGGVPPAGSARATPQGPAACHRRHFLPEPHRGRDDSRARYHPTRGVEAQNSGDRVAEKRISKKLTEFSTGTPISCPLSMLSFKAARVSFLVDGGLL